MTDSKRERAAGVSNVIALKPSNIRPNVAQRLFEEATAIEHEDARRAGHTGYFARSLVQATLPYKEPDPTIPVWSRTVEDISLMIKPGYYIDPETQKPVSMGYPYGSLPRLLIAWISTEVKKTKERELVLGSQLSDFMAAIGMLQQTGGASGNITRLRDQMKRLFAADMAIVRGGAPGDTSWSDSKFTVAKKANLWWDTRSPQQAGLWESSILLSEELYKELVENPVPIDMRALSALRQAPMAIDLYCWLTWRFFSLNQDTTRAWESLHVQFGSNIAALKKFKERFLENLEKVLLVYPDAKVTPTKAGLLLQPSLTSIKRKI